MEPAEEERRERHLAVYGLSGTVQRVVAPLVAGWLVGALPHGGRLLAAAVFAAVTLRCHAIPGRYRGPVAPRPRRGGRPMSTLTAAPGSRPPPRPAVRTRPERVAPPAVGQVAVLDAHWWAVPWWRAA
ncbi:hypothetical protein ACFC6L_31280 [Kitasatospora phosalacinea]|uniref:hypothetical protein n=1 Tax=Kitasatospora phosalacinea TaxID=2065 RepID=UPI0035DE11FC